MKVAEIIAKVDELRPNQYDLIHKTQWLNEVEGMIVDEILNMAEVNDIEFSGYDYASDFETELKLPDRFTDIYEHYLRAKIEFSDDETAQYNNAIMAFQSAFDYYAAYYRRHHMPKAVGKFIV